MASAYRSPHADLEKGRPTLLQQGGRRLSKPRTKTLGTSLSTGNLLDSTSATSPKPSPSSIRTESTFDLLPDASLARKESHRTTQESWSPQNSDHSKSRDEDGEDALEKKAHTVKQRISRTGTMLSKKASLRLSLGGLRTQSHLSLPLFNDNPEETGRMIDEIKQKARNDRMIALNHVTSPVDGEEGQPAPAPIRRRSLFTPGLATRNPSDLLKKPPNFGDQQRQREDALESDLQRYYNPRLSESSPLGRIAALDLANGGRNSPISRCSTPGDFDYGHLGSKCTLRITNGAASPIPSMRSVAPSSRKSSSQYQGSSYTAPEGDYGGEDWPPPSIQQVHRRSLDFVDRSTTPRQERYGPSELGRVYTPLNGPRPSTAPRSPLRWQSLADMPSSEEFDAEKVSDGYFDMPDARARLDRASMIAQEYIADIAGSPYASTSELVRKPSFEPTTKANEIEAELFDDAASDFRTQRWSTSLVDGKSDVLIESTTISHSTSVTTSTSAVSSRFDAIHRPELASNQGDSGYSSSTSLGSMGKDEAPTNQSATGDPRPTSTRCPDSFGKDSIQHKETSTASVPLACTPLVTIQDEPETVAQKLARPKSMVVEPVVDRGRSRRTAYRQTSSGTRVPLSTYAPTEEVVSMPYDSMQAAPPRSTSSGPKKLQKKPRPKSMPPPIDRITVQSNREVSGNHIPPIPADMAARHAARFQDFPTLNRTVADLRSTQREKKVNSAPVAAPVRFPSPAQAIEPPKKRAFSGRKISFTNSRSPEFLPGEARIEPEPSKSERRWSRQRISSRYDAPTISDFGDVTEALGESPYDAAYPRSDIPATKRSSRAHPHQLTTAMPRAKSMIGMNDIQASELSQLRNYYGNPPPTPPHQSAFVSRRASDLHDQKHPQRSHFNDRGGIPGKMPRPKSMMTSDIPPMPAIPVKTQIDDMEKQAKVANRQTVAVPSHNQWDSFSAAWAQRRKSAGEGLLSRPQQGPRAVSERPHVTTQDVHHAPVRKNSNRPENRESLHISKHPSRSSRLNVPESRPSSQEPTPSVSKSSSMYSLRGVGVEDGTVARLSGRFENGFAYGYEPGQGIGGSAGTRSSHTIASRKSVDWSKGYGVDLSDVPIFVCPTPV